MKKILVVITGLALALSACQPALGSASTEPAQAPESLVVTVNTYTDVHKICDEGRALYIMASPYAHIAQSGIAIVENAKECQSENRTPVG